MALAASYFVACLLWSTAVAQDLPCHPVHDTGCGGVRDDLGTNVLLSKAASLKRMNTMLSKGDSLCSLPKITSGQGTKDVTGILYFKNDEASCQSKCAEYPDDCTQYSWMVSNGRCRLYRKVVEQADDPDFRSGPPHCGNDAAPALPPATEEPTASPPAAAAPAAEPGAAPASPAATTEPTAAPPAAATPVAEPAAAFASPAATTEPTAAPSAAATSVAEPAAAPAALAAAPPATIAAPAATTVTTTMSFPERLRNADCDSGEGVLVVRVRKEIRSEAPEKWTLLKAAWRSIGLSGTYNWFGERHDVAYGGGQDDHGGPTHTSFLPFHRMLGLDLENVLRQEAINAKLSESRQTICSMTVPYWDWTDRQLDMVLNSEYLGGTDAKGCIANGLPAGFETPATFFPEAATDTDPCVKRNTKMRPPSYDGVDVFETVSTTRSDYLKFSELVEKLHNDMHYKIGGNMLTRVGKHSPSDPVFFFHHQFIDMLWYVWQKTNRDVDVDEMRASLSKVKSNNRYELAPWITSYDLIHDCVPMPGSSETPAREDTCLRYESHLTPSDPCAALRDQIKNGMCTADDLRGIPCVHSPECTEKREPALCADEDAEDCDEVVTLDEAMEKSGQFCQTYVLPTDNVHCHSCSYLCGR